MRWLLCLFFDHDYDTQLVPRRRYFLEVLTCKRCKATSKTILFPSRWRQ